MHLYSSANLHGAWSENNSRRKSNLYLIADLEYADLKLELRLLLYALCSVLYARGA